MKKGIPILIILGMLGWAIFEFVGSKQDETNEEGPMSDNRITAIPTDDAEESDETGLERGQFAPDFEVMTLEGEQRKLSDYRGKRVMLNFWATWCPPCRAEMPDMQKLYENEEVTVLALNMTATEQNEEVVADFVEEYGLTFPILMDEESDVMNAYRIQAYPTSYMIDSNGRIQFIALGAMNYDQMLQHFNRME